MKRLVWLLSIVALAVFAVTLGAQQDVPMRNNTPVAPQGIKIPPLPDTPVRYETAEGQNIRVSVYARGFHNAWSMAFVSDDTILVAERAGAIRVVRNGVVDPQPAQGAPVARGQGLSGMDLALHPDFERNHYVYISYSKPLDEKRTTLAVARAVWDGKAFTGATDIFVGEGGGGGPIAFGGDGMLYIASGGGAGGPNATQMRNSIGGKILRLTDTGAIPKDNPFVGQKDARPEVFTMGHRNTLRLAKHPGTGAIWQVEDGPNGGDEVNILKPGRNYGWPFVSDGRDYRGHYLSPVPYRDGMERPHVLWVPSIAVSGMAFYTADRFPNWQRNLFVGGMREGEIARTGQLQRIVFNDNWDELRRESLLRDLHQRIRDVRQGPDGLLYVLTEEDAAALLKIEPVN
jgi:glucose/arabinose dehydrogenase